MAVQIKRALLTAAVIAVFLVLAGATYQGAATALERRQFPHPGRLIDIGDRQLHLYCTGTGAPTVVLEAPAAGMSAAWGWVQSDIERSTRVCSYDRAGLGWSEAGDPEYEPVRVPEQLHALLERSGERPPFVLAGDGLGAAFVRLYAARFGETVQAVVLIDGQPSPVPRPPVTTMRLVRASPWLARTGILRMTGLLSERAAGLPEPSAGAMSAFLNRPDHLTRAGRELARWDETLRLAAEAPLPPDIEVVEVTVTDGQRVAFLTDAAQAEKVTAAIAAVIRQPGS